MSTRNKTKTVLTLAVVAMTTLAFTTTSANAAPIAGIDFDDGSGAYDRTPDDLDVLDGILVSDVGAIGAGSFKATGDGNSNAGRPSPPVGKIDGTGGTNPGVGAAPTADGAFFSITIPAGVIFDLDSVDWVSSQATGTTSNVRWLAFKTSLDATLLYSAVGVHRPNLDTVSMPFTDPMYKNLTDTTIEFQWYAGGSGTGDQDMDTIVINGTIVPEPTTLSLLALGLLGWRRRRNRA